MENRTPIQLLALYALVGIIETADRQGRPARLDRAGGKRLD
jgi:hypothetical protein